MSESGFDVSMYQDGAYAGGGGFSFGFAKVTEGVGYKDPAADRHMAALLAQPPPFVAGAYHFARPDLNPGTNGAYAEADWFWSVATSYRPGGAGLLLADDQEVGSGALGGWRDDFCGRLAWRLGGYQGGWYSYDAFVLANGLDYATNFWSWFAWPDANGPLPVLAFSIAMQQYGLVSVPGVVGQVDANRFFGTVAQLARLAVPLPPPPPSSASGGAMLSLLVNGAPHLWFVGSGDLWHFQGGSSNDLAWAPLVGNHTQGTPLAGHLAPGRVSGYESGGFITLLAALKDAIPGSGGTTLGPGQVMMLILKDDGSIQEGWQPVKNASLDLDQPGPPSTVVAPHQHTLAAGSTGPVV